jgi:hypothetical protein
MWAFSMALRDLGNPWNAFITAGKRQIAGSDLFSRPDDQGPFNNIFQFPNISGPMVIHQLPHGTRADFHNLFVHFHALLFYKSLGQQWNIFLSFAKGRHMNGNHVKAIEKVLAKIAFCE